MSTISDAIKEYENALNTKNSSKDTIEAKRAVLQAEADEIMSNIVLKGFKRLSNTSTYDSRIRFDSGVKDLTFEVSLDTFLGYRDRKNVDDLDVIKIEPSYTSFGNFEERLSNLRGSINKLNAEAKEKGHSNMLASIDNTIKGYNAYKDFYNQIISNKELLQVIELYRQMQDIIYDDKVAKEESKKIQDLLISSKENIKTAVKNEIVNLLSKGMKLNELSTSQIKENASKYAKVLNLVGVGTTSSLAIEYIGWNHYDDSTRKNLPVFPLFFDKKSARGIQSNYIKLDKENTKSVKVTVREPKQGESQIDKENNKKYDSPVNYVMLTSFGSSRKNVYASIAQGGTYSCMTTIERLIKVVILNNPSAIQDLDKVLQFTSK